MTPSPRLVTPERVLQHLEWRVVRRLDGLLQGDTRTLAHGVGLDFSDLREYQVSDDVRHIDWNVTARMGEPYVRQYLEDRDHTAWFLLDRSSSMAFGSSERPKEVVLAEFVTVMARLLTRAGNRVGAILYDNGIERTIEPGRGRTQVLRLTSALLRAPTGSGATTDLTGLLEAGQRAIRRRSLVFVVSDFMTLPGWERALSSLTHRHELVAVRLTDPREQDLPDAGIVALEDAETGEQLLVDTGDEGFRRRFREVTAARETSLHSSIERTGVDLFDLSTADDLVTAIARMAQRRKRRAHP